MLNDFYVTITGLYNRQCSIYMLGGGGGGGGVGGDQMT